jgi:hypothetical protein
MTNLNFLKYSFSGEGYDSFIWKDFFGNVKVITPGLQNEQEQQELKDQGITITKKYISQSGLTGDGYIEASNGAIKKIGRYRIKTNGNNQSYFVNSKSNGEFMSYYGESGNYDVFIYHPQGYHEKENNAPFIINISSTNRPEDNILMINPEDLGEFLDKIKTYPMNWPNKTLKLEYFTRRGDIDRSISAEPKEFTIKIFNESKFSTRDIKGFDFKRFTRWNWLSQYNPIHNWKFNKQYEQKDLNPLERITESVIKEIPDLYLEDNRLFKVDNFGVLTKELNFTEEIGKRVKYIEIEGLGQVYLVNVAEDQMLFLYYCQELDKIYDYHLSRETFLFSSYGEIIKNVALNLKRKMGLDILSKREKEKLNKLIQELQEGVHDNTSLYKEDSYNVGNCEPGTEDFIRKYNLKVENGITIGDIRQNPSFEDMLKNKQFLRVLFKKFKLDFETQEGLNQF